MDETGRKSENQSIFYTELVRLHSYSLCLRGKRLRVHLKEVNKMEAVKALQFCLTTAAGCLSPSDQLQSSCRINRRRALSDMCKAPLRPPAQNCFSVSVFPYSVCEATRGAQHKIPYCLISHWWPENKKKRFHRKGAHRVVTWLQWMTGLDDMAWGVTDVKVYIFVYTYISVCTVCTYIHSVLCCSS